MIIDTTCSAMERKMKRALELELKISDLPKWEVNNFKMASVTASKNTPVVFECGAATDNITFYANTNTWSNVDIYWREVTPEQQPAQVANDPNWHVIYKD